MRRIWIRLDALLLLICLMPGCTGYRSPTIELESVRLVERTEEAAAFHFDLRLENPNPDPIELREFQYTLSLDGTRVYEGRRAAITTLHPGAANHLVLPAVVRYAQMGDSATLPAQTEYLLRGALLYETPGELAEILLDIGVRRPRVEFKKAGRLTLESGPAPR